MFGIVQFLVQKNMADNVKAKNSVNINPTTRFTLEDLEGARGRARQTSQARQTLIEKRETRRNIRETLGKVVCW